jgi:VWFA-related protein
LTKSDFTVSEDGQPQQILSFDVNGFTPVMDYQPAKMPPVPANTFVNLPATPEKGPLYVLLYDLTNMDNEDQMTQTVNQHPDQIWGRKQLVKFIENKPEGTRFAIFVRSDGLHLIQGFTSDKNLLYAAIDPNSNRPHIPEVYLMGENTGRGDPYTSVAVLNTIGTYLEGMPGRKNLIWFSGTFPLSLFPDKLDGPNTVEMIKATMNLMARAEIAIYPVDVRGVVVPDWHSTSGLEAGGEVVSQRFEGSPGGGASSTGSGGGQGYSLLGASYSVMDEIARQTGGRAYYSDNIVSGELERATENGGSYYTLTYSPTNKNYDGKLRHIQVHLKKNGTYLQYRHMYYGINENAPASQAIAAGTSPAEDAHRDVDDSLDVNMRHGAPVAHQLVFGAHIRAVGAPAKGTPEQMAQLSTQPAFSKGGKGAAGKTLPPVPLQKYVIDFTVMAHQLHLQDSHAPLNLEIASAAYDTEGRMLNGTVNEAKDTDGKAAAEPNKALHMEQELELPLTATSIRVAVRDMNTQRIGAMEVNLPLAPENQSASTGSTATQQKTN